MNSDVAPGTQQVIDGRLRVYHDGYWIKAYRVPADTLVAMEATNVSDARRLQSLTVGRRR